MKKKILLILLITLVTVSLFASDNEKYEYMVVSFGKAQFSDLRSKTMAYWEDGISKEALSATSYEKNLDILGEHGWEVVSITGVIGGDQQVILKRNLDIKRSETELKTIDENSKKVIDGWLDKILAEDNKKKEAEQPTLEVEKPTLIELDAYEAQVALEKQRNEFENSFSATVNSLTKKPLSVTYKWNDKENDVTVSIDFDVTNECLIQGNKYRVSKVKEEIKKYIIPLKEKFSKNILIGALSCNGYITYMDESYYCGHLYTYTSKYGKNGWSEL